MSARCGFISHGEYGGGGQEGEKDLGKLLIHTYLLLLQGTPVKLTNPADVATITDGIENTDASRFLLWCDNYSDDTGSDERPLDIRVCRTLLLGPSLQPHQERTFGVDTASCACASVIFWFNLG